MGITGLIPFLEKASSPINIRQYKGQTVAIDAYCWLHRGIFSCAEKLARGEKCDQYITYCLKFVNMLISHDIKPIMVFDGRYLPAKAATEKKRRQSREQNRAKAAELLRQGRTAEARRCLRNSLDVGPGMAAAVARACRSVGADCIFAPFEADAQLAYLNKKGIASAVITEDSDLILFGCVRVIFKLDLNGSGLEVVQDRLHLGMGVPPEKFSIDRFRQMCILSGCDYLESLPGIGLAKAKKFVNTTLSPDISQALGKLPSALGMYNLNVTEEYMKEFILADATFLYQTVYDPIKRMNLPLNNPEESSLHVDLAEKIRGKLHDPETEFQLALGNLDPFTQAKIDDFNPDGPRGPSGGGIGKNGPPKRKWKSIWDRNFVPWGNSKTFHSQDALMMVERESTWGINVVMGVSFLQASSGDTVVRRSPRKRKNISEPTEEDLIKETPRSDTDLGILYGAPPLKKTRIDRKEEKVSSEKFERISNNLKPNSPLKTIPDSEEEKDSTVEEDKSKTESGVLLESGESCKENSFSVSENNGEVLPKQNGDWLESFEKVTPKTPAKDKKDGEDSGIVCGSSPNMEDNSPLSPIIGSKRKVNPFAKPLGSCKESPRISGGILSSSKMFSKIKELNKSPEGVKVVVKSRYFASSSASFSKLGETKIERIEGKAEESQVNEAENKSTCKANVSEECVERQVETLAQVLETYSESKVEIHSPPKIEIKEVVQSSPRKTLNPFFVEKKSPASSTLQAEKPEEEEKKLAGPRKPLFNWGSLQAKFSFGAATCNEVVSSDIKSSSLMNGQVKSVAAEVKSPVRSAATPSPARGRGRGSTCKRPGLVRSSTPKAKSVTQGTINQQSLLSRFGFQKKS